MLEISNNSTSIMRSCQMKYRWNYIEGLKPIKKSAALSLGSVIHSAFDMFYCGFSHSDVLKYISDTMNDQISKASPTEVEEIVIIKYTLLGMWTSYPFKLDGFTKIEPEKEFRIKVPGTRGIEFVGRVDGLVTDINGKMWVRELKTTSQTQQQFEVRVKHSSQGTAYVWAMRKLGFPVQGMIYDYVKKPLLRKGVNEDMNGFGTRIFNDYGTRPDVYYKRHYSYRTDAELVLYEQDLKSIAYDIRRRRKDGKWYRNQDQCWNFNQECPYLKICFSSVPDPLTIQLYYERKTGALNAGHANSSTTDTADVG